MIEGPRIEVADEMVVVGIHRPMSFAEASMRQLWQAFRARVEDVKDRASDNFISLRIYDDPVGAGLAPGSRERRPGTATENGCRAQSSNRQMGSSSKCWALRIGRMIQGQAKRFGFPSRHETGQEMVREVAKVAELVRSWSAGSLAWKRYLPYCWRRGMRATALRRGVPLPAVALLALWSTVTGCEVQAPADAEGQAIIYGTASLYEGGRAPHASIDGIVYRGQPCGADSGARPFQTEADSAGAYRVHLKILTRDPFWGCIEVVGRDPARGLVSETATREQVYFNILAPFDSARLDVVLR